MHGVFQTVWFILWGILWTGYFVLDGFDLGAGIIFPWVAKTEEEKRLIYNAIGPFWESVIEAHVRNYLKPA